MTSCPYGGEPTVGMNLTDIANKFDCLQVQTELVISISENGICKSETIKHICYVWMCL